MRKKTIINPKTGRPFPNPPAFWSHMYRIGPKTVNAVVVDTTHLTLEQVVSKLLKVIKMRLTD